jgi:protein-S-isoprenylcysteine O-methyltransferase Ste14
LAEELDHAGNYSMKRHWQNWLWIVPLLLLGMVFVHPHYPFHREPADPVMDALGALLVAIGIGIRVCARGWKYEAGGQGLVTDGLYGYVRHPLYVGSFLIGLGLCLIIGVVWYALLYIAAFVLGHASSIGSEEASLGRRWPVVHADYRVRIPAVLPTVRQLRRRRRIRPHRLGAAIVREADAVCLWPLAMVGLKAWEAAGSRHPMAAGIWGALVGMLGSAWLLLKYGRVSWRRSSAPPAGTRQDPGAPLGKRTTIMEVRYLDEPTVERFR